MIVSVMARSANPNPQTQANIPNLLRKVEAEIALAELSAR
jgi:hypothetical protein